MKVRFLLPLILFTSNLFAQQSWNIDLLYNWNDTSLIESPGYNGVGSRYNEVWGMVVNGREYAVIGSTMGTHIFDVTDPINTVVVDFVPGEYQSINVIHRDYHDYKDYLYMICGEGGSGLQIADLSYLPDSVNVVYSADSLINTAHNIFIDSATAKLYGVDVRIFKNFSIFQKDIKVLSLADPTNPELMVEYSNSDQFHDVFVRNDTVYSNNYFNGVSVFDFSDTSNIQLIASLTTYPLQGLNHSGWLSDNDTIFVFTDETHGTGVKICDVSDFGNISILYTIQNGVDTNSVAHNVMIRDDFLYIAYYHDGLYIYDISNPSNPVLTGLYDTYSLPDHDYFRGAWGVYSFLPSGNVLVSDMQYGLFVLDVSDAIMSRPSMKPIESSIVIHPNPTAGKFTVKGAIDEIQIFDLFGRLVLSSNEPEINMSSYPAGLYVWQVGEARGKLVKE